MLDPTPDPQQSDALPTRAAERLIAAVQELSLARELPAIQAVVRRAARELSGADGATFVLREGENCFYADEDAIAPLWKGRRFPLQACISGWSMLHREAVVIPDIYADPRIPADAYRPTFVKSLALVPIRSSAPIGAIGCYWAGRHHASQLELRLLQALADSTSIAIENAQLYTDLERRVQERSAALEMLNHELEAFAYSISHDLRAPLRAIQGFDEILLSEHAGELSGDARHCSERIRDASRRMEALIEGLLLLSRVGRTQLRSARVDVSALAHQIAAELREADSRHAVQLEIAPGLRAGGDPELLRILLENLLRNAWKFTRDSPAPRISVEGEAHGEELLCCVRDNGAGFDMAHAKNLFAPFKRLHGAEFEGTGVGLSIAHRVIARHGGRIWAEGAPEKGAAFHFALPLHELPAAAAASAGGAVQD